MGKLLSTQKWPNLYLYRGGRRSWPSKSVDPPRKQVNTGSRKRIWLNHRSRVECASFIIFGSQTIPLLAINPSIPRLPNPSKLNGQSNIGKKVRKRANSPFLSYSLSFLCTPLSRALPLPFFLLRRKEIETPADSTLEWRGGLALVNFSFSK